MAPEKAGPKAKRQDDCTRDDEVITAVDVGYIETMARIPYKMAYAGAKMEEECKRKAEQDNLANQAMRKGNKARVGLFPLSKAHEPGNEDHHANRQSDTRYAV